MKKKLRNFNLKKSLQYIKEKDQIAKLLMLLEVLTFMIAILKKNAYKSFF